MEDLSSKNIIGLKWWDVGIKNTNLIRKKLKYKTEHFCLQNKNRFLFPKSYVKFTDRNTHRNYIRQAHICIITYDHIRNIFVLLTKIFLFVF